MQAKIGEGVLAVAVVVGVLVGGILFKLVTFDWSQVAGKPAHASEPCSGCGGTPRAPTTTTGDVVLTWTGDYSATVTHACKTSDPTERYRTGCGVPRLRTLHLFESRSTLTSGELKEWGTIGPSLAVDVEGTPQGNVLPLVNVQTRAAVATLTYDGRGFVLEDGAGERVHMKR